MVNRNDQYVLNIDWDPGVNLPRLIGPFDSEAEAMGWAACNVPNGTASVESLAFPYLRSRVVS